VLQVSQANYDVIPENHQMARLQSLTNIRQQLLLKPRLISDFLLFYNGLEYRVKTSVWGCITRADLVIASADQLEIDCYHRVAKIF
jgi:hypothetical protein